VRALECRQWLAGGIDSEQRRKLVELNAKSPGVK
jgi:hypothetical protein